MKGMKIITLVLALGILAAGCSDNDQLLTPQDETNLIRNDKDGTEALGEFAIASGSGLVEGGVGMVDTDTGILEVEVPDGATINQVLLYWMGGSTVDVGDDTIEVDGTPVTGDLIGGPTNFFWNYDFYAYRADVTDMGWVTDGLNSFTITGMDFLYTGRDLDENNGVGMVVIYDDATEAELQLFDGLDMAFFKFSPTLDATSPVTFEFAAEDEDRTAELIVLAGSVDIDRPNQITVTTSAGEQLFDNPMGSFNGLLFDAITLEVLIPAGDTMATAQLFSVVSEDPLGASMGWLTAALSVPVIPDEPPSDVCTRTIGYWKNHAGFGPQDDEVTPLLPVTLGDVGGAKSLEVTDAQMAVDVLRKRTYGRPWNGVTKLYAQLLAAKLNVANGADDSDILEALANADAFLASHDYRDWRCLSRSDKRMVLRLKRIFDDYNNGRIGPGHCDDDGDRDCRQGRNCGCGGHDGSEGRGGRGGRGGGRH